MEVQGRTSRLEGAGGLPRLAALAGLVGLLLFVWLMDAPVADAKCKGKKCDKNANGDPPGWGGGSGDDLILNAPWVDGKKFIIGGKCGDFESQGRHEDSGQQYEDDRFALDIGYCGPVDEGAKILAGAPGEVIAVDDHPNYGNTILIQTPGLTSPEGAIVRYAHLKSVAVEELQQVASGALIGTLGHTGAGARSKYNAHLHLAAYSSGALHAGRKIDALGGVEPCDICLIRSETPEVPPGTPPFTPHVTGQSPTPETPEGIEIDNTEQIPVSITVDFPNNGGVATANPVLRPIDNVLAQQWFGSSADVQSSPIDADTAVFHLGNLRVPSGVSAPALRTIPFQIVKRGLSGDQIANEYAEVKVKVVPTPDSSPPTITVPPSLDMVDAGAAPDIGPTSAPGVPTTFAWQAADNAGGSGIHHYEYTFIDNVVQPTQTIEAGSTPSCTQTQCSVTRDLLPGHVYKLTVRAVDFQGNQSPPQSSTQFLVTIRDDSGNPPPAPQTGNWAYGGYFNRDVTCPESCWGGDRRETENFSASQVATLSDFTAFQVGFVGLQFDGHATQAVGKAGKADVSFDNGAATRLNWFTDNETRYRQIMLEKKFSTTGSQVHDMKLTWVAPFGDNARVNIDAVVMFSLYPAP